jgi:peptidoglycan/LPS O-acetylase OafA/YrhL
MLITMGCGILWLRAMGSDSDDELTYTLAACAMIVAGTLALENIARHRPIRLLRVLGEASYSMYLFHPLFQRAALIVVLLGFEGTIQGWFATIIHSLIAMGSGLLCGPLVYVAIERPLLRWSRGLTRRSAVLETPVAGNQSPPGSQHQPLYASSRSTARAP